MICGMQSIGMYRAFKPFKPSSGARKYKIHSMNLLTHMMTPDSRMSKISDRYMSREKPDWRASDLICRTRGQKKKFKCAVKGRTYQILPAVSIVTMMFVTIDTVSMALAHLTESAVNGLGPKKRPTAPYPETSHGRKGLSL